ncbi:hypothetical protein [Zoogloea sp.]|uniref:hypothetical protein n=1 Tax=Zoogloea sp. TaxID=49181 RepID=UPI001416899E|nr:MAG: hypothetical protein F9K15_13370 [Zoogloea sp.]
MPNVFLIMGDANARKSSTIRGLTGVARASEYDVETFLAPFRLSVYAKVSSLQESHLQPVDFIQTVDTGNYDNVLVSVWFSHLNWTDPITQQQHTFPRGEVYVQQFLQQHWIIQEIVCLGVAQLPNPLPAGLPAPLFIPLSPTMPSNEITSDIRRHWNWM